MVFVMVFMLFDKIINFAHVYTNTYPLYNIYRVTSEKGHKRKQTYIRHEHRTCMFAESMLMVQLPEF